MLVGDQLIIAELWLLLLLLIDLILMLSIVVWEELLDSSGCIPESSPVA